MRKHALHLVTTGRQELEETLAVLSRCDSALIDVVHIREKHRTARDIMRWHHALAEALPHTRIYINDRVDAAAAVDAPGVQLGYASVPPATARRMLVAGTRIGRSVHSAAEAEEAQAAGADFVIFGHVYATGSKEGLAPRGPEALADVVRAVDVPVIAIGGIEPDKVGEVLSTGAAGIAVMSSVFFHADPGRQAALFRAALDSSTHTPRRLFT
ncbi:thiamine phosphate synthase [Paenibacillus hamazuiensis]|uniref:thiamine phosphate synthase n=1 Tax=Paenibacillus hamazuiensis TaxID=2936508 RepID=UPI00200BAA7E|nr:thiamine phosphate synthase [Paenibacillus hamazuiensis]